MRNLQQLRFDFMMNRIDDPFSYLGDAAMRFDTYVELAKGAQNIVELGVYTGLSTSALLLAKPAKMLSVDVQSHTFTIVAEIEHNARLQGTDYKFLIANDLEIPAFEHDLLFIDTTHEYQQTLNELDHWGKLCKGKIILHDACVDSAFGAMMNWVYSNREYHIVHHDNRDCGLMVLERYPGC